MGPEPTVEPRRGRDDPASESAPRFDAGADKESRCRIGNSADTGSEDAHSAFAAASDDNINASADLTLSSIAAAMTGDRAIFLQILSRAVDADISPAARRSLQRGSNPASDEAAAFERLVAVAIDEAKPSTATTICAALAARTVARSLLDAERVFGMAEGEAMLSGWLDTARAVAAARGSDGLLRLLPTARKLARRTTGRSEPAAEIATTMRRVAARIAADLSLDREVHGPPEGRENDRMLGGMPDFPRRIVIQGQVEFTFHTR
jgi:hypothetical protein